MSPHSFFQLLTLIPTSYFCYCRPDCPSSVTPLVALLPYLGVEVPALTASSSPLLNFLRALLQGYSFFRWRVLDKNNVHVDAKSELHDKPPFLNQSAGSTQTSCRKIDSRIHFSTNQLILKRLSSFGYPGIFFLPVSSIQTPSRKHLKSYATQHPTDFQNKVYFIKPRD